jgi:alpha-soluble NSF attachment protein
MANTLTDAFKVYRKDSPQDAARVLSKAIQHYTLTGSFRRAASHQQNLGEIYEADIDNIDKHKDRENYKKAALKAKDAYDQTARWYESDNAEALANKFYLKAADLAALAEDYPYAMQKYEAVAKSSLNSNLMIYSVNDYLLKSGICALAIGDEVVVDNALERFPNMYPNFTNGREYKLLEELFKQQKLGKQDEFADALAEYDNLSRLDRWKTEILLRVKNAITEKEDDFS